MSVKVMSWVWEQKLPCTRKMILLSLADHSDDEGVCWPHITRLATKCNISKSCVKEHLKKLREDGIIDTEKRKKDDGSYTSSMYRIVMNQVTPGSESGPPRPESGLPRAHAGPPLGQELDQGGRELTHPYKEPSYNHQLESSGKTASPTPTVNVKVPLNGTPSVKGRKFKVGKKDDTIFSVDGEPESDSKFKHKQDLKRKKNKLFVVWGYWKEKMLSKFPEVPDKIGGSKAHFEHVIEHCNGKIDLVKQVIDVMIMDWTNIRAMYSIAENKPTPTPWLLDTLKHELHGAAITGSGIARAGAHRNSNFAHKKGDGYKGWAKA